jgi:REP element-mobilizing transposase RayT
MKRIVTRVLPSGETKTVYPFHVCIKGAETAVHCRNDEDYDVYVKYIALCARRKNVLVIIYAVVSNHCHVAVLAARQADADAFAQELKKMYAQWFRAKYNESKILHRTDAQAILLDNDWYVRNALAYIPRNALDNGCSVQDYLWSGFRAMFKGGTKPEGRRVASLTKRETGSIMHTRDCLKDVPWLLDEKDRLIPDSFCDTAYLEEVFNEDPAFWLKTIGAVNPAEMDEKLIEGPRRMLPDAEFMKIVTDTVLRWFSQELSSLPKEKKVRIIPYLWRTRKTTAKQLARVMGMPREEVEKAVKG